MSSRRPRRDETSDQNGADDDEVLRHTLQEAVNASVEAARKRGEEERARLLAEAGEEAAKVTAAAEATKAEVEEMRRVVEKEVEGMRRKVQQDRAALEAEKAAMDKAHDFQSSKICLDVGGHKFTTSRQTLTSIPDTYLSAMFSGRFALAPDADGAYFIDRDGKHFGHVLNFLRDPVNYTVMSSDATEAQQRKELQVEVRFYGLLDYMMPEPKPKPEPGHYAALDLIGQFLLKRACLAGTARAMRTAMAQSRVLVFKMGAPRPSSPSSSRTRAGSSPTAWSTARLCGRRWAASGSCTAASPSK
jgi:hypothetical protein